MHSRTIFYFLLIYSFVISTIYIFLNLESSPFLGDQIDQFQNASALFEGNLKSLYGPYLSTTQPIVYPIGPFIYLLISFLKIFSNHPFWIHFCFGLINIVTLLFTFISLNKFSKLLANSYLFLSLCSFVYWFALSILWSNVILYSLSSMILISYLEFLRRKKLENLLTVLFFLILSLHLHLISIVFLSLIIYGFLLTDFKIHNRFKFYFISIFISLACIPYLYAEAIRKFANTKAILFNQAEKNLSDGLRSSEIIFSLYLFPFSDKIFQLNDLVLICNSLIFILILLFCNYKQSKKKYFIKPILLINLIIAFSVILFYAKVGQAFRSIHYFLIFLPFSLFLLSYFALRLYTMLYRKSLLKNIITSRVAVIIFCFVTLYTFEVHLQKYHDWNFNNSVYALQTICRKYPRIDTFEWNEFRSPESKFEPVLVFMMTQYKTNCIYDKNSQFLLFPSMNKDYPNEFQHPISLEIYNFLEVYEPGIAIYQKKI